MVKLPIFLLVIDARDIPQEFFDQEIDFLYSY